MQNLRLEKGNRYDLKKHHSHDMKKEFIIQKLKEKGCRITKQRLILLEIILAEQYSCCKEIYYKAAKMDDKIGAATVYRLIRVLEEIGAIDRKNMYKIACEEECLTEACTVELDDNTMFYLSPKKWDSVIMAGLKAHGYVDDGQKIKNIEIKQSKCGKCI